jgi:hypothetical protein
VSVTLQAFQKIFISAQQGLGSTLVGGANGLDLYVCYQLGAGTVSTVGQGIFGLTVPQNQRHIFGISAITPGLAAGTYNVGLCGSAPTPANWNNNEFGYVTALVLQ